MVEKSVFERVFENRWRKAPRTPKPSLSPAYERSQVVSTIYLGKMFELSRKRKKLCLNAKPQDDIVGRLEALRMAMTVTALVRENPRLYYRLTLDEAQFASAGSFLSNLAQRVQKKLTQKRPSQRVRQTFLLDDVFRKEQKLDYEQRRKKSLLRR